MTIYIVTSTWKGLIQNPEAFTTLEKALEHLSNETNETFNTLQDFDNWMAEHEQDSYDYAIAETELL
jgi:hypothetical protein